MSGVIAVAQSVPVGVAIEDLVLVAECSSSEEGGTKFVTFHCVEDPEVTHEAYMLVTEFDRWVADDNIPGRFEYGKGWWDYVALIRRFANKFDIPDVRVVGHYVV